MPNHFAPAAFGNSLYCRALVILVTSTLYAMNSTAWIYVIRKCYTWLITALARRGCAQQKCLSSHSGMAERVFRPNSQRTYFSHPIYHIVSRSRHPELCHARHDRDSTRGKTLISLCIADSTLS